LPHHQPCAQSPSLHNLQSVLPGSGADLWTQILSAKTVQPIRAAKQLHDSRRTTLALHSNAASAAAAASPPGPPTMAIVSDPNAQFAGGTHSMAAEHEGDRDHGDHCDTSPPTSRDSISWRDEMYVFIFFPFIFATQILIRGQHRTICTISNGSLGLPVRCKDYHQGWGQCQPHLAFGECVRPRRSPYIAHIHQMGS